jgi:hypothetical protein
MTIDEIEASLLEHPCARYVGCVAAGFEELRCGVRGEYGVCQGSRKVPGSWTSFAAEGMKRAMWASDVATTPGLLPGRTHQLRHLR